MSSENDSSSEESDILSLSLVLAVLRRRWPWIIICALLGSCVAFYLAAKQGYSFEKTARIILRDDKAKANSSDAVLSELGIKNSGENLANETYVLKSTDLMLNVVSRLKLNVCYWKVQDIRKLDIYNNSPIEVSFENVNEKESLEFEITPQSNDNYVLVWKEADKKPLSFEGQFGKSLVLPFAVINVRPTSFLTTANMGQPIIVSRVSTRSMADDLLAALNVLRPDSKEASIIELKIKTSNPEKSKEILDELIAVYNQSSKDEKTIAAKKTEEFIKDRILFIGGNLGEVDSKILDQKADSDILQDMQTTLGVGMGRIKELEDQIFKIETEIKQIKSLSEILNQQETKRNILPVNLGVVDSSIAAQIQQYNTAFLEYKKLEPSAGKKNPLLVALVESMEAITESIKQSTKNYLTGSDLKLQELLKSKKELESSMVKTASTEKDLVPLLRQQKVMEQLFLILLTKREENGLALARAEESARILESAFGSNSPVSPKMKLMVVAGAGCGGVLCFMLFLGLSLLDNKVKTRHELQEISSIPVLAEVPSFTKKEKKSDSIIKMEAQSPFSEAFHILRSNLDSLVPLSKDKLGQIILVSSTRPGEGKTTITSNLAVAYALSNKRVLLVDCDLRRGTLTKSFTKRRPDAGLSKYLLDESESIDKNLMRFEAYPNLDLLCSGFLPPNPVVLFSHERFNAMLEEARRHYDKIILDAPPYSNFADGKILSEKADIFLYLIRSLMIEKPYIQQFLKEVGEQRTKKMGFVINDLNFKHVGYGYYGYRYGYGYSYKYTTDD